MNIVAVTACPTGIAHTYMAAEQLEKTGKALGHNVKVETQGSGGVENELTAGEIAAADVAIFAVDIMVEGRERFDRPGLRILEVPVSLAIKDPKAVYAKLEE
jgi:fructose-specific phosphotransferase system IIB component